MSPMTDFEDLTRKQQLIIDSWIAHENEHDERPTYQQVADRAYDECPQSYVAATVGKYDDVLRERKQTEQTPMTDGEGSYLFELGSTDTWKAIRLLPEELSQKIYDQVREQ